MELYEAEFPGERNNRRSRAACRRYCRGREPPGRVADRRLALYLMHAFGSEAMS
jgi:hypothetical protein